MCLKSKSRSVVLTVLRGGGVLGAPGGQGRVHAPFPMNHQDHSAQAAVHIGNDFSNESSNDPLPQTNIRLGIIPDRIQLPGQAHELLRCCHRTGVGNLSVLLDTGLDLAHLL
jgi:hypothetical protein